MTVMRSAGDCLPRKIRDAVGGALAVLIDDRALSHAGRGIFFAAAAGLTSMQATVMATRGRGLLSIAIDMPSAMRLGISHMPGSQGLLGTEPIFLVSIEAASCPGTGISAEDRALTIRVAGDSRSTAGDLATPGHIMPLLVRRPLSEAATLAEIAHAVTRCATPAGAAAWCDILDDAGGVASAESCRAVARQLGLHCFTSEELRALLLDLAA
jgi:3,4-dihydroxy 2-butanone 4-phosphate synthase/GTP cyclohydrolase II